MAVQREVWPHAWWDPSRDRRVVSGGPLLSVRVSHFHYSSFFTEVSWLLSELLSGMTKQGKLEKSIGNEGQLQGQSPEMNHKEPINSTPCHMSTSPSSQSLFQFRLKTCPDITAESMSGMRGIPGHSHLRTVSSEWESHSLIYRESSVKRLMDDQSWCFLLSLRHWCIYSPQ